MAKATINEPDVEYDVVFWDGKEVDTVNGTGHPGVVLTSPVDERARGLIYGSDGKTYTLWPGDAIIKHIVDGKVIAVTGMGRDEALAKFNIDPALAELTFDELALPESTTREDDHV
jgi:hypothetical protein